MTCLSLTLCKNFKTSQKNVSIPRMDEKKLHTWEFQLKVIGWKMRCKLLQKRSTGKTTECSKHLQHIAIEKDIFSRLNRCIFQISLKYIKLVTPKILFIVVLRSFKFYFKITYPPAPPPPSPTHTNKNFWPLPSKDFSVISNPPPPRSCGEGGCIPCKGAAPTKLMMFKDFIVRSGRKFKMIAWAEPKLKNFKFYHFEFHHFGTFLTVNLVNVTIWPGNFVSRLTIVHIYNFLRLKKIFTLFRGDVD